MIAATLLPDEALALHFEDENERFLHLAQVARSNLEDAIAGGASGPYAKINWNAQYVHEISAIADALGIKGLPNLDGASLSADQLAAFDVAMARILTRIRVTKKPPSSAESVQLSFATKATIRADLERLREQVENANIAADLREALHKKIDAVERELDRNRSSLNPIWALHGLLIMVQGVPAITGTLADLKPATEMVQSILQSVQQDKQGEVAEQQRLHGEQLKLSHIATKAITDQR